jgi:hypothetical protein
MRLQILNQKATWIRLLVMLSVFVFVFEGSRLVVHAAEDAQVEHAGEEATHDAAKSKEQHGTPFSYLLAWLLLAVVGLAVLSAWRGIGGKKATLLSEDHGKSHPAPPFHTSVKGLSTLVIIAVFVLFFVEGAIGHYNEGVVIGLVRTGFKMLLGVMLIFFGTSFLKKKQVEDSHDEETSGAHH